ncbi:MAG TPA: HAMP domain-containing sensor histidine kinase, partial [Dehalococcoidia bacterium]|nr:HAMP domain-containing sensor histidine kinase [Dehalococcoidia bacterium]
PAQLPGRRVRRGEPAAGALIRYRNRETGEERWSMVRAMPVTDAQGTLKFAVSVTQDVTALRRALEEAQTALAIRQRFLAVASHELRTPLTALKGQLQLVRRRLARGVPAEALDTSLRVADRQLDRLTRLVDELLDVSRLGEGRVSVAREAVDVAALLRHIVEQQRDVAPERPISLELDALPPRIDADPFRLEQALANLIANAAKYSPPEAPIVVRAGIADGSLQISVLDEGIGVPAEEREAIFESFHRAANVDRAVTGFGLGLYIARELVRLHGGTLYVEARPEGGSIFTVTLPLPAG